MFVLLIVPAACGNRDEKAIRKNLDELASLVEKAEKETVIQSGLRANRIASFFTTECRVAIGDPVPRLAAKQDILHLSTRIRQRVATIDVSLSDVEVFVDEGGSRATSTLTAAATVSGLQGDGEEMLPREIEIEWTKDGKDWRIEAARTVDVFR